jgi:hypothetical protein
MDCDFLSGDAGETCSRCGYTLKRGFDAPPNRQCAGEPGLGDWLAAAIKRTARLLHVSRWLCETAACGCKNRKRKVNRFGRWVAKWRKQIAGWLKALLPAPPAE